MSTSFAELRTAIDDQESAEDRQNRELLLLELAKESAQTSARAELLAIERALQKRRWAAEPDLWLAERIQEESWSKQREVLRSVRDHRKTSVQSCHEIGKSWIASRAAAWWLDTHKLGEAFVVTTAPTARQVRAVLWHEIGTAQARLGLGRSNQTEWYANVSTPLGAVQEQRIAFGFKPASYDPAAFQGIHRRFVLAIVDEACGVRGPLWDAIESLCANDESKILLLGNPDDPNTEFFLFNKPGSGYNVISVSAFETPTFTGENVSSGLLRNLIGRTYVEDRRKKWAPRWTWLGDMSRCVPPPDADEYDTHPFWQSKVLGRFPKVGADDSLIPLTWVHDAQRRELVALNDSFVELGVDVGGGGDASVTAKRQGPIVRIISEDHNPNTMETCGKVVAEKLQHGAVRVKVDSAGMGIGIVNRGNELGENFTGINVGRSPICICGIVAKRNKEARMRVGKKHFDDCNVERFANLRAQLYWELRDRFEVGTIDIDEQDSDLASELCSLKYKRNSKGQILLESKDDMKRRGVASPNRAEAVMLSFGDVPPDQPISGGALSGKVSW